MIGCLRTRVRKQPIILLYSEFEAVLKFYNLEAWIHLTSDFHIVQTTHELLQVCNNKRMCLIGRIGYGLSE